MRSWLPHLDRRWPLRKDLRDVRRPLERVVVEADEHVVLRHAQIRLDEVGLLLDRELVRRNGVFRRRSRRAPMRDEDLASLRAQWQDDRGSDGGGAQNSRNGWHAAIIAARVR